jgi:hypothetical protein
MAWPEEITLSGIYCNTTVWLGFTTDIIDKCSLFGGSHYHSREGEGGYVFEIWRGKEREVQSCCVNICFGGEVSG